MAIVVNPTITQRPDTMNQLAMQVIAQKQAKNKENARNDLETEFSTRKAEIEQMQKDGRLVRMLNSENPEESKAARQLVAGYMDVFARRSGRKMSPEMLKIETDAFINKFSAGSLTNEELARESYPGPGTSSAPPSSSPASSSPDQPPSSSAPASGEASATPGPVTTLSQVNAGGMTLTPDTITGEVPPAVKENLGGDSVSFTSITNEPYKGKTFEDTKAQLYAANKSKYPDTAAKIAASRTWDDLKGTGVKEGWKAIFGEYPDGSKTTTKEPPKQVTSTEEISAQSKEIAASLGDEFVLPKIAQKPAADVQNAKADYDRISQDQQRGIRLSFKDMFKKKQVERQAAAVWVAQQQTPGFKKISAETKASMREFVKTAQPAELAAAGMASVAEIKNDQERNEINRLIAESQVKVATLQKEATANAAFAQVLMSAYKEAFSTINTVVTTGKNEKGINDLLKTPALQNAFNTIASLLGGSAEDYVKLTKVGFFGSLQPVQDPTFIDPLTNLTRVLETSTQQQGNLSEAQAIVNAAKQTP